MTNPEEFQLEIQQAPKRQNVKTSKLETVDGSERLTKDFLTGSEVDQLLKGARRLKYGTRDVAMVLLMYRHGFRVSELIKLRKSDVNLDEARIAVTRLKGGLSTHHPLQGDELRAIKAYLRTREDHLPWLFINEKGDPLTRQALNYIVSRAGQEAGMDGVHPHMLRHSCGYALADKGLDTRLIQDYLGHRDIRHTAHYTRTSAKRFESIWK